MSLSEIILVGVCMIIGLIIIFFAKEAEYRRMLKSEQKHRELIMKRIREKL